MNTSVIVKANVGGAVFPPFMGHISDLYSMSVEEVFKNRVYKSQYPFSVVNCLALTPQLFTVELGL